MSPRLPNLLLDRIVATALMAASLLTLVFLGYAGDRLIYIWRLNVSPRSGLEDNLPPLSKWLLQCFGYNEPDLTTTLFIIWLTFAVFLIFVRAFYALHFYSVFYKAYILFATLCALFLSFLIMCAALPFYYLIQALHRPDTFILSVNHYGVVILCVFAIFLGLYILFRSRKAEQDAAANP